MRLVMCLGVVAWSACRAANTAPCPVDRPTPRSSPPAGQQFVTKLPITSRAPVFNQEAALIAGYRDDGIYLRFTVINLGYHLVDEEFARKSNPSALARLAAMVNAYLAPGRWRPMILGTKRVENGTTIWDMGDVAVTDNNGRLIFKRNGSSFAESPFFRLPKFPYEDSCDEALQAELTGIAIEPVTQWVWVTYQPKGNGPGPGCSISWVSAFQVRNYSWYPYQISISQPASEM